VARITAIETQKRNPDRVNVHLDGKFAFAVASTVAAGLKNGLELTVREIEALQIADSGETAYQRCVRYLSFRVRSESEIRTFLKSHNTREDVLEETLRRLRDNHLVDDRQFAHAWVENRSAFRPRGGRALTWELRRKGLAAGDIESAVRDLDECALAYEAGRKPARRLAALPWQEFRRRLYSFLSRRDFPAESIAPVITRLWSDVHDGHMPFENEETQ
jgi:regulatory protein